MNGRENLDSEIVNIPKKKGDDPKKLFRTTKMRESANFRGIGTLFKGSLLGTRGTPLDPIMGVLGQKIILSSLPSKMWKLEPKNQ